MVSVGVPTLIIFPNLATDHEIRLKNSHDL